MEFHQLRYFCAVARAGSFTRAAEEEGVAQPTLSQQVKRLEEDLGLPLFERRGRSVRLTSAGETLLPQARAMLRLLADARRSVADLREGVQGRLAVGCIPTITPYLLAPKVSEFQAAYPDVQLQLVENLTARLVEGLQAGDLDVAVLSLPVAQPDLVCSEVMRERLLVALPVDHPLARKAEVDPREIRSERMLVLREGHCFREEALRVCRRARLQVGDVFESDQFSSVFALVAAGFGAAIVPEMAARAAEGCAVIPLRGGGVRRVGYAQIKRPFIPPAQKAFVGWFRDAAKRSRRET